MTVRETLEHEAAFEPTVRALVRSVNERLGSLPSAGEFWVRVRPPTLDELDLDEARPAVVKFHRVGALVQIAETLVDFVEVFGSGETLLISLREFLETWVQVQEWPGPASQRRVVRL